MSADALYSLAVLALTIAVFVSDRLRLDIVALLATLALFLGGQIDATQAVAGLGDSIVVLIAGLFVVGEALYRTGVAHAVGGFIVRQAGEGEAKLIALMMVAVAGLSAFMSSTGAVAVFIPIALGLARRTGIPRKRLLMPLAIAAMIGGMLTLIGTPPNLVVTGELERAGLRPFAFFDFTPIGFVILAVGVAYMALVGRHLLEPATDHEDSRAGRVSAMELVNAHDLRDAIFALGVGPESPLVGQALREAKPQSRHRVTVAVMGDDRGFRPALPDTRFAAGDTVYVTGEADDVRAFAETMGLALERPTLPDAGSREIGVVEVLVSPQSQIAGRTVAAAGLRASYGLTVLSVMRNGERVPGPLPEIRLQGGDVLLLSGGWAAIRRLGRERPNLFVLRLPTEADDVAPARAKAPVALAVTALMMVLLTFNIVPSVIAVLMAALAMVLGGCLDMNAAYRSINWQSILLIAFMLPMATALDQSGALALIVDGLVQGLGGQSPLVLLAVLFALTSLLSQVISNTATTVLLAPVALSVAARVDIAPETLLMGVAIAASTAFSTPVASPVNTLVLGPGRFRFVDFLKVGVPLQLAALCLCLLLLPLLFPF